MTSREEWNKLWYAVTIERYVVVEVHYYENISRINYKAEKNRVHKGYTRGHCFCKMSEIFASACDNNNKMLGVYHPHLEMSITIGAAESISHFR